LLDSLLQEMTILLHRSCRLLYPVWSRLPLCPTGVTLTYMQSSHTSMPVRRQKKELVTNTKYGPVSSNPLYENLVYSSEVDVYLTVKRGKVWLEMQAAKTFQAENELKERQRAAQASPVPLALQYLYGGAQKVQREEDITRNIQIDVQEELMGHLESGLEKIGTQPVYPYSVYQEIGSSSYEVLIVYLVLTLHLM